MKRWGVIILALVLLVLAGCTDAAPETTVPVTTAPAETTTLLIYMVGSDLEAKAGAASKDLAEIADSGIDLTKNNVLVYTGGTTAWHNEVASSEQHRILQLTPEGFTAVAATEARSMGDSYCLTNFLNYAWSTMPADQFALILWDHGDGPVIGYGRDMLFGNDSLTLKEMEEALSNSPFGQENKLAWVGFDACMMASAELCCTWEPYAAYLVASQEVEPSFGWDYSFLSDMGAVETPALLASAAQTYLATCQAYYESRDYGQRDTTMACIDLSKAQVLEERIDALFQQAADGIDSQYNELVVRRVQTRALARTTTGSEYDLIDLQDMAAQLQDLYPEESAALQEVLGEMVLTNATNTTGCCGMSLYYPFYNKSYYSDSWSQAYQELGLFPAYQQYLQSYQQVWLRSDFLNTVASSQMPVDTAGTYTLQLTPQQQETFASARYYILIRDGEELYTRAFTSENITNDNGLLTANFEGNVIYVRNPYGTYHIPVVKEHDTVGDKTRYSAYVKLANGTGSTMFRDDIDWQVEDHRICLTLDNTSGEISIDGIIPCDFETQQDTLAGGKLEEGNLADWPVCYFVNGEHRYLTRNENRTILGLESWLRDGSFSATFMSVDDGFEFVYMPLTEGEYYLAFEIEDTQGNRYCSELLPIETEGTLPVPDPKTPIEKDFTSGDRIELYHENGVKVDLLTEASDSLDQSGYIIEVSNENDFPVRAYLQKLYWGDTIYCGSGDSADAEAGTTVRSTSVMNFDTAGNWARDTERLEMTFELYIINPITWETLLDSQPYHVRLSEETLMLSKEHSWSTVDAPCLDARAQEQVLLDTQEVTVTLLDLGSNSQDPSQLRGVVCVENHTDRSLAVEMEGVVFNGVYIDAPAFWGSTPANCKTYQYFNVADYQMEPAGIQSIGSVTLLLTQKADSALFTGNTSATLHWCPVELSQSGTVSTFQEGERVLMDQGGVRITVLEEGWEYSSYRYKIAVVNNSDQAIAIDAADPVTLERLPSLIDDPYIWISDAKLGPNQCCIAEISVNNCGDAPVAVDFRFRVLDYQEEAILFYGDEVMTITAPEKEKAVVSAELTPQAVQTLTETAKTGAGLTGKSLKALVQTGGKLAGSRLPKETDGVYTLELTPQQKKTFASATYYILCRENSGQYSPVFSSQNVTYQDGVLTAGFDGKVLYAGEQGGQGYIAKYTEETVAGQTQYKVGAYLDTGSYGSEDYRSQRGWFYLTPDGDNLKLDRILSDTQETLTLEDWESCSFYLADAYYLTRNPDGTLPGLESWIRSTRFGVWSAAVSKGVKFTYEELTEENYYLMFEIQDTQGNRYCSELLQLEPTGTVRETSAPKTKTVEFLKGDRVQLYKKQGVTVELLKVYEAISGWKYRLSVTNTNDFTVSVDAEDLIWGDDIYIGYIDSSIRVPPGETKQSYTFDLGDAGLLAQTDEKDITLTLTVTNETADEILLKAQPYRIKLSKKTLLLPGEKDWYHYDFPALDARAEEQVLLDTPQMKVTLLGLGGDGSKDSGNDLNGAICIENRSGEALDLSLAGSVINGIFINAPRTFWNIPAGGRVYKYFKIDEYYLEDTGIDSVETLQLLLQQPQKDLSGQAYTTKLNWCPVTLEQSGTAASFPESRLVLMNQDGVRITLLKSQEDTYDYVWILSVVNTTQEAIAFELLHPDALTDSTKHSPEQYPVLRNYQVGPNQSSIMKIALSDWEDAGGSVAFRFRVMDFTRGSILFHSQNVITLKIEE